MTEGGAWGAGLATFAGDRILEVFYPDPQLGGEGESRVTRAERGSRRASTGCRRRSAPTTCRDVRQAHGAHPHRRPLARRRDSTADAYLRLHLLSHRLVKPHDVNLDGIFGALPNVAWTSVGPVDPANLTQVQLKAPRRRHRRCRSSASTSSRA